MVFKSYNNGIWRGQKCIVLNGNKARSKFNWGSKSPTLFKENQLVSYITTLKVANARETKSRHIHIYIGRTKTFGLVKLISLKEEICLLYYFSFLVFLLQRELSEIICPNHYQNMHWINVWTCKDISNVLMQMFLW